MYVDILFKEEHVCLNTYACGSRCGVGSDMSMRMCVYEHTLYVFVFVSVDDTIRIEELVKVSENSR